MELAGTKAITKMWAKIKAYIATKLASYLPLSGGTLTGDLLFSDSGTATRGIYGTVGSGDAWRLIGGADAPDLGWLELATADGGNEPIYVRQYTRVGLNVPYCYFSVITHSATLLDASGNTLFPGIVTASAFSGNASSATKLATARSITLSGDTTGTATFDGSDNITISTSTNCASEAKALTTFSVCRQGSTNSYGLIASLSLPYYPTSWEEVTGSIYVSYNHNDAPGRFGLIRLKASGMGGTNGNYGYYSALQLGNLDSSIVRFSYIAPTSSASGSLNVYAYGNNDKYAQISVTSLTNDVSIYNGGFTVSSIPGVEFYLSDMYMPNVIPNRTNGALTITKNGTSVGTFNGSADTTIALTDTTYSDATTTTHGLMTATDKVKLDGISSGTGSSSIQPFDFYDSNERGTFWTQTNTNSIAVPFMTDSKVVTHKVRIFIKSTAGAKIRCAIYKKESSVLSLVTQTQLYTGQLANFVGIPFETIATLDSDTLYYFVFECSSSDSAFLGKQINASLLNGFVYDGDAFNADDTFKSQYPTDGPVNGNVFIPYFKII